MGKNAADEQLIQFYQKGDSEAFELLYARYKSAIYHYFFRQVHSKDTADELHQDVWLNIIKSSSRFTQQSSFKTWLYKIAHNRLVDHYRQSSRQPLYLVKTDTQNGVSDEKIEIEKAIESSALESNEPEMTIQEQQVSHLLLQGINDLPEEQREVFLLHEKSGLTLQEIALVTDSSFESTKSRLRYAIKKLRHHMNLVLTL